jgi:hypothetical protein
LQRAYKKGADLTYTYDPTNKKFIPKVVSHQYEPYYLSSDFTVTSSSLNREAVNVDGVRREEKDETTQRYGTQNIGVDIR